MEAAVLDLQGAIMLELGQELPVSLSSELAYLLPGRKKGFQSESSPSA